MEPVTGAGWGLEVLRFLEENPFVLLFATLALGTRLGRLRLGFVPLGSTAATLLVGLAISLAGFLGHGIRFSIPGLVTTVFLNLFMFAVGLKVGPQFFAGLRKDGAKGIVIAVVVCGANFAICLAGARLLGLPPGFAPGLISGSMTDTAVIGVATAAIESGSYQPPAGVSAPWVAGNVAAAYAVTYLFSLVGILLLVRYLPRVLGLDAPAAAREAEAGYAGAGAHLPSPGVEAAYALERTAVDVRAYRLENEALAGLRLHELSLRANAAVLQVLRDGAPLDPGADPVVERGDVLTVLTDVERLAAQAVAFVGPEVADEHARTAGVEVSDLVVTRPEFVGLTLEEASRRVRSSMAPAAGTLGRLFHPLALIRDGVPIPVWPGLRLERGDILRVAGRPTHAAQVGKLVGASVRVTTESDILTVALGLAAGYVAGTVGFEVGGIPLHLGAPAGVMLAGITISAVRARHPQFGGPVSEGARSLLQALGLDAFIAVVALNTAPNVVGAYSGGQVPALVALGLVAALVPPMLAWFVGRRLLGLNPAILAGAICGARHSTPALRVAQEEFASAIPAAGYPVAYAVSSVLVLVLGYLSLFL